ncbi:MAG: sugar phosphate isomerase/epimerase family protein [Candidatus Bathyarchaeia archaeon]
MKEISWKRFGYHVVYDTDIYDAINFADKHGFGYIVPDLMIPRFFPERFSQSERRRIQEFAESKNVSISFHGPSDYMNLGSVYPEVRKAVLDRMKLCIDFSRDINAQRFTIHIDPPFDFVFAGRKGTYLKDHWTIYKDTLTQSLVELVEYSQGDILICVENDRLSKLATEVLEELLATEKIFLTWDIPKSHTNTGEPIVEMENFLIRHLERVRECHLHDQKPGKYSHDILGVGKIDFSKYLRLLVSRDVHFTLEIRPREYALKSLRILQDLLKELGWKMRVRKK